MKIEITIWDVDGNVVTHEFSKSQIATQNEIDEMVQLIENSMPAWLAARLVTRSRKDSTNSATNSST